MAGVVIIVAFVVAGLIDLRLRKKFSIARNEKFMDQYVNFTHFTIEAFACVIFMTYITGTGLVGAPLYSQLFLFLALFFVSRALAEYVYFRPKRKHLMSAGYTVVCAVCSLVFFIVM
ncbi:MAG: DUF4181 domain-containing protein [Solibacillus sp.]